jgi:hypothetical protein
VREAAGRVDEDVDVFIYTVRRQLQGAMYLVAIGWVGIRVLGIEASTGDVL